jgi:anti-sigma regulatory factor (Ser/Thr protein kinase)
LPQRPLAPTVGRIGDSEGTFESRGRCELPRSPDAGRHARVFLDRRYAERVDGRTLADARLIATELANNAVVHGEGRITLCAELVADALRVEVVDEGTGNVPAIREEAEPDGFGGRGLRIVDELSSRWGVFEGTTHVWADVPLRSR